VNCRQFGAAQGAGQAEVVNWWGACDRGAGGPAAPQGGSEDRAILSVRPPPKLRRCAAEPSWRSSARKKSGARNYERPNVVWYRLEAEMNQVAKIEIPVEAETAAALSDARRREAVGRLVDRMVRPTRDDDPLAAVLEATARQAREEGLTDEQIDAELAAYNAERRQQG